MKTRHPKHWAHQREGEQDKDHEFPRQEQKPKPETPRSDRSERSKPAAVNIPPAPDHYATLGVDRWASQEEIVKAAKSMRIEVHPDRLRRKEGLTSTDFDAIDEQAKKVGWAADILCDPVAKARYDRGTGR